MKAMNGLLVAMAVVGCSSRAVVRRDSPRSRIPVSLQLLGSEGNSLANDAHAAPDFVMEVVGCASTHAAEVVSTAARPVNSVFLFKGDVGCAIALREFSSGGEIFTAANGGSLSSGSATFQSASRRLFVEVLAQLDSPLTSASSAVFRYREVNQGDEVTPLLSESHMLALQGVSAPQLDVWSMELAGPLSATGVPTFAVAWECQSQMVGSACPVDAWESHEAAALDAKLVVDQFGGSLTFAQAEGIFSTPGVALAAAADIGTHGGVRAQLMGPGALAANPHLLLVVRYRAGGTASFTFAKVNIGAP